MVSTQKWEPEHSCVSFQGFHFSVPQTQQGPRMGTRGCGGFKFSVLNSCETSAKSLSHAGPQFPHQQRGLLLTLRPGGSLLDSRAMSGRTGVQA